MAEGVTYAEVRRWAVWLQSFTASDLSDALRCSLPVAERGVKALLFHGICERTGEVFEGPDGPEEFVSYVPLPPGPTHHPHEEVPERKAVREAGGDPLRVKRGIPVALGPGKGRSSVPGRWRPGRTQGPAKAKVTPPKA